jgi:hypothetical protein
MVNVQHNSVYDVMSSKSFEISESYSCTEHTVHVWIQTFPLLLLWDEPARFWITDSRHKGNRENSKIQGTSVLVAKSFVSWMLVSSALQKLYYPCGSLTGGHITASWLDAAQPTRNSRFIRQQTNSRREIINNRCQQYGSVREHILTVSMLQLRCYSGLKFTPQ